MGSELLDHHSNPSLEDSARGIWIVVPSYREGARLESTLQELHRSYSNIIVVDDGSDDDTFEVASDLPVWTVRHSVNLGQGAALQTGFDFALSQKPDAVVTFDGDGQHQVEDIQRILEPVLAGRADVALGSRFLGETIDMPRRRWLILKLGVLFTRIVSRIRVTDTHNGLRALSPKALRKISIKQKRMAHASEILDQIRLLGLRYEEVPVTIRYTKETVEKGQRGINALRIATRLLFAKFER